MAEVGMSEFDVLAVQTFLGNKWHGFTCEVCTESNWNVVRADDMAASALGIVDANGNPTTHYWPVAPVVCMTCGNTKLLFLIVVSQWLATDEGKAALEAAKGSSV